MPQGADIAVTFPADLPVVEQRDVITRALDAHQVVVVCGETGSGKSTQLPKICLDAGRGVAGRIGLTQPRRLAARSIARRLADELGTTLGGAVGYKIRFTDRTGPDARIKVMTDGILLAETQGDRRLAEYDTIIVDEAHERSLNIDFLLGYLAQLLPRRPELKLIVSSATIDPQRFSAHFGDAPIVEVEGRVYPVDVRYRPPAGGEADEDDPALQRAILAAVDEIVAEGPGDTLVFLSGEREIRGAARALRRQHGDLEVLPLYARLPAAEQQRVFERGSKRRVVLATNVAETSLTVPGIRYVIDPGLARISRYSARSRIQRLPIEPVSQASARQRAGRCGRLGPGICIRLYDEDDFETREAYTPAEILRSNLAGVILRMKSLGLGDVRAFPFLDPPPKGMIADGEATLHELGAIDDRDRLTELGRRLSRLPVDPRLGRMILAAEQGGCLRDVLTIVAALSVQDPRERPHAAAAAADEAHEQFAHPQSDFLTLLNLWDAYHTEREHHPWSRVRAWCRERFVSFIRMREWADVRRQLADAVGERRGDHGPPDETAVHRAILTGLLAQVGTRSKDRSFTGPRSSRFHVHPGSTLFEKPPPWVMAAEIVDTTKRYARGVARIEPAWIEAAAGHLVKRSHHDPYWDPKAGRVMAYERVTLGGLELVARRRVPYDPVDRAAARKIFIAEALVGGRYRSRGGFAEHNRRLVEAARTLEAKRRRRDILVDPATRFDFFDGRVPPDVATGRAFERWRRDAERTQPTLLHMEHTDVVRDGVDPPDETATPDVITLGAYELPLHYRFEPGADDDGITVRVPLALLEQVPDERLAWGVPGQLHERVTALIRAMPKPVRRRFVPAPDWASEVVSHVTFGRGPFVASIVSLLEQLSGGEIPADAVHADALPDHLRMRISVVDADGAELAAARSLETLRKTLRVKARETFARLAGDRYERDGITTWDLDDLPDRVEMPGGMTGYPALVDCGESAALRVLPTAEAAEAAHRRGVLRLFLLRLGDEVAEMFTWMPGLAELERLHTPLGTAAELRDALMILVAERVFVAGSTPPRTAPEFERRLAAGRDDLWPHAEAVCGVVEPLLVSLAEVTAKIDTMHQPVFDPALDDVCVHLKRLLVPGVLSTTPFERLQHFPRYLQAVSRRLDKLPGGIDKDRERVDWLAPWIRQHDARHADHATRGLHDTALEEYRWMLEEMRVSLWAQELGTAVPVSDRRLAEQWARVRT